MLLHKLILAYILSIFALIIIMAMIIDSRNVTDKVKSEIKIEIKQELESNYNQKILEMEDRIKKLEHLVITE